MIGSDGARGLRADERFRHPAAEARACRTDCALFDFSFLECARLQGPRACSIIETFIGRSLQALAEKQIFYALRVDAGGAMVADLTIWRTGAQSFDVMSGRREDVAEPLPGAAAAEVPHFLTDTEGDVHGRGLLEPRTSIV